VSGRAATAIVPIGLPNYAMHKEEAMSNFESLLRSIAKRPGMYVGKCSLRAVSDYLSGYDYALHDLGCAELPLSGWMSWVEARFLISHPAWHWTRILLHAYGTDQAALEALPQLYQEFLARRAAIGVEGIEAEHTSRFIDKYGQTLHEPAETSTTVDD
jgi:hypothetical protein